MVVLWYSAHAYKTIKPNVVNLAVMLFFFPFVTAKAMAFGFLSITEINNECLHWYIGKVLTI